MTTTSSILDRTIGDGLKVGGFKHVPEGRYLLQVVDYAFGKAGDSEKAELKCAIVEPLDGQDLEGIKVDKVRLKGTLWLTERAHGQTSRAVKAINPEIPDELPLRDAFELIGERTFVGVVKHEARRNDPSRVDAIVDRYFPAA
jgi:hypothetical protein